MYNHTRSILEVSYEYMVDNYITVWMKIDVDLLFIIAIKCKWPGIAKDAAGNEITNLLLVECIVKQTSFDIGSLYISL